MPNPRSLTASTGRTLEWNLRPAVMGIINATPDSFYADSRLMDLAWEDFSARFHGADILDVGGESSRPGSAYVSDEQELNRVLPLIKTLRSHSQLPISVDTRKAGVALKAFQAGADWVNDISAMRDDPDMSRVVAETGMGLVLMHMQGTPVTMQAKPSYGNVVVEVRDFLRKRVDAALGAGVREDRIMVDPGIGFGKSLQDNLKLLRELPRLDIGFPLLIGLSRKSFINMVSESPVEDRLGGSLAGALWAASKGAAVLRVHDVGQTLQALKVWTALEREESSDGLAV